MALDFPNSPTAGQLYAAPNGVTYQWSSTYTAWLPLAVTSAGVGDFYANAITNLASLTAGATVTLLFGTVVSGNAGGWYSPGPGGTGRFTPPAGRYHISAGYSAYSASGGMGSSLYLRKNGVTVVRVDNTSPSANQSVCPFIDVQLDANGTDYFDVQAFNNTAVSAITGTWFGAFPISAAGPAAGTVGSWRRIARVVPIAGQAAIDFINIPADINDLELRYDVTPATNGVYFDLQLYNAAGTLLTGNNYVYTSFYQVHNSAVGANVVNYPSTGGTSVILLGGINTSGWGASSSFPIQGKASINNIRDVRIKHVACQYGFVDPTNVYYAQVVSDGVYTVATAISGLHLYMSTGNFAAGGAVSLYGSP